MNKKKKEIPFNNAFESLKGLKKTIAVVERDRDELKKRQEAQKKRKLKESADDDAAYKQAMYGAVKIDKKNLKVAQSPKGSSSFKKLKQIE